MKKISIIVSGLVILGIASFLLVNYFWQKNKTSNKTISEQNQTEDNNPPIVENPTINNFNDCVAAGNPVMESYPRQCSSSQNGMTYTEDIGNALELQNMIVLENPLPNQVISSPLTIKGQARGNWFFEASFPVSLVNWDGLIIADGIATAKSDWMTTEFVPFEVILTFDIPDYKNNGWLILKKDNPSGLPEFDNALEIPILFETK